MNRPFGCESLGAVERVVPVAVAIPVKPDIHPQIDVRIDDVDRIVERRPLARGQIER